MQADLQLDPKDNPVFRALPAIFRDCVAEYSSGPKFDMRYPQQIGDHIYATDGRILVRTAATPAAAALVPCLLPKRFPESAATAIRPRDTWHAEPTPLPSLGHLERCDYCDGTGHQPQRRCRCDDFDTPCHDRGIIPAGPCWDCDGTGIKDPREAVVAVREDVHLSAYYLTVLARHNATLYLPVATVDLSKSGSRVKVDDAAAIPVYFTVGDADGVLMTCKPPAAAAPAGLLVRPGREAAR